MAFRFRFTQNETETYRITKGSFGIHCFEDETIGISITKKLTAVACMGIKAAYDSVPRQIFNDKYMKKVFLLPQSKYLYVI